MIEFVDGDYEKEIGGEVYKIKIDVKTETRNNPPNHKKKKKQKKYNKRRSIVMT
jgi:hypothetical protein